MDNVHHLYTPTEKKLIPIYDRIMEILFNGPEELSLAEVLGMLEIIKHELLRDMV